MEDKQPTVMLPEPMKQVQVQLKRWKLGMWLRMRGIHDLNPGDIFCFFNSETGLPLGQNVGGPYCVACSPIDLNPQYKRQELDSIPFPTLEAARACVNTGQWKIEPKVPETGISGGGICE